MSQAKPSPEQREAARITARILLDIKALNASPDKPFTFTSGRTSPVYVDIRRLISFPEERATIMDLAVELIRREIDADKLDVIAGGETAGIPFAAWIAERLDLPMLYVRKQAKGFGRMAQIEGQFDEGARVLLVEDLSTDAGSKIKFCDVLRKAGAEVSHTLVVFEYGIFPESKKSLRAAGLRLHALATWWDVIGLAEEEGYFDANVVKQVRAFLKNPEVWAQTHAVAQGNC